MKKKITIIIGGGIAAYKSLELIRFLQSENYEIILLFSKNAIITLSAEIIEVTLEDQINKNND